MGGVSPCNAGISTGPRNRRRAGRNPHPRRGERPDNRSRYARSRRPRDTGRRRGRGRRLCARRTDAGPLPYRGDRTRVRGLTGGDSPACGPGRRSGFQPRTERCVIARLPVVVDVPGNRRRQRCCAHPGRRWNTRCGCVAQRRHRPGRNRCVRWVAVGLVRRLDPGADPHLRQRSR